MTNLGFNEVAEANNIIVVYPQTVTTTSDPRNPEGCFEIYGFFDDGLTFATKEGEQIKRFWNMAKRLAGEEITAYEIDLDSDYSLALLAAIGLLFY